MVRSAFLLSLSLALSLLTPVDTHHAAYSICCIVPLPEMAYRIRGLWTEEPQKIERANRMRPAIITLAAFILSLMPASAISAQANPSEKRLRGCLHSMNGKYILEQKNGKKNIALGGSRGFSSYVGKNVLLYGTFQSPGPNGLSSPSSTELRTGAQFVVSKLEITSESCNLDKGIEQVANSKPSPYHK